MKTFIISFPKSGRTWLRALIGNYLKLRYSINQKDFLEVTGISRQISGLNEIIFTHDNSSWMDSNPITTDKDQYHGNNVIMLSRNPYDVFVSSYFQITKREKLFTGTMTELLNSEWDLVGRLKSLSDSWQGKKNITANYVDISYEEMHQNPEGILLQVLKLCNHMDIDMACVKKAVEICTFDNMKKMEADNILNNERLRPTNPNDPESFKVRNGKVGDYHNHLTLDDIELIDRKMKNASK